LKLGNIFILSIDLMSNAGNKHESLLVGEVMSLVIVSPCRQYLRLTLRKKVDSTQFIIHKGTFWRRFAMSRITISDDPNTASAIPSALERNARARARVHETTRMEFLRYRPEFTVVRSRARARARKRRVLELVSRGADRSRGP